MSEQNNGQSDKKNVLDLLRGQLDATNDDVLRDVVAGFPALRRFLLGGEYNGHRWPAGQLTIRRSGYYLCVRLSYRDLGKEAVYFGQSFGDLTERIENDLDTQSCPWEDDYQTRKEEERWLRRSARQS